MGFVRWGHEFDGTYPSPDRLENLPGVYVLWCVRDRRWDVLEVGSSAAVRVTLRARGGAIECDPDTTLHYSATYAPGSTPAARDLMAQQIWSRIRRAPRLRLESDAAGSGSVESGADSPPSEDAPPPRRIDLRNSHEDVQPPNGP